MAEHNVAPATLLREGRGIRVFCAGEEIALFKIQDAVYAVSNFCPHQHIPKLHDGACDGSIITCPMHGWSFDLVTGKAVTGSGRLKMYPVRLAGGDVFVDMADDSL